MSTLGIVTVVTNEKDNLRKFHSSLSSQTFKDFTLYFVDNVSSDGSREYFEQLNSDKKLKVKYIALDSNSGFSGGSNIGAKAAVDDGCEYLFILNNDVELEPACIEELLKLIETDDKIACTGLLLFMHKKERPGVIQEYGGRINFKHGELEKFYTVKNVSEVNLPEVLETDFIGGGVCFIKSKVFNDAGMFEESYFGYFDEIDLAYRLKVLNNYKMFVTSKAVGYHNHSVENKSKSRYYREYYLSERNRFLYFKKFGLKSSLVRAVFLDLLKFPVRLVWFIKVCSFKLGLYYLKGMLDGLLNKKGKPAFVK